MRFAFRSWGWALLAALGSAVVPAVSHADGSDRQIGPLGTGSLVSLSDTEESSGELREGPSLFEAALRGEGSEVSIQPCGSCDSCDSCCDSKRCCGSSGAAVQAAAAGRAAAPSAAASVGCSA